MSDTRKDPKPEDAKYLTRKFASPIALIILIDPHTEDVAGASWGTDPSGKGNWKPYCELGGKLLTEAVEHLRFAMEYDDDYKLKGEGDGETE